MEYKNELTHTHTVSIRIQPNKRPCTPQCTWYNDVLLSICML